MLSVTFSVGIDVGKNYLDVGFFPIAKPFRVVNERKRCFQATSLHSCFGAYAQGRSWSIWLLGWPLTIRVMTSAR